MSVHEIVYSVQNFFSHDPATTKLYTLSLHDALPIWIRQCRGPDAVLQDRPYHRSLHLGGGLHQDARVEDRKSTRLNSSHRTISYAVFCLKKKTNTRT